MATVCPGRSDRSGIRHRAANHRLSACLLAGVAVGREGSEGCTGLLTDRLSAEDARFAVQQARAVWQSVCLDLASRSFTIEGAV